MVGRGPRNLGNRLGRRAVALDFSVMRIAHATGATRQTVYNWIVGGDVLVPYRPAVERLLLILKSAETADTAWGVVCKDFNLTS